MHQEKDFNFCLDTKSNKTFPGPIYLNIVVVATLTLGSQPRQGLARLQTKKEARESHRMLPGVTSHAPRSLGKCEGMNPHTYEGASTLGIGLPMDSRIFKKCL
jgi:hypothetical protein